MIKSASIYKKPNKYIIHANSHTTAGVGIASEPFIILPKDASQEEIAQSLLTALSNSKEGVKHPTDWKKQQSSFLSNIQEKSLKSLHLNTILCDIVLKGNELTLYPMSNKGPNSGFEVILNSEVKIEPQRLQDYILTAFEFCK